MKPVVLVRSVLLGACLLCLGGPMGAQPQPGAQQVRGQWLQLRRTWSASELTDPQSAIAAYQKFYGSLGDENGDVAVEVVSRVAQLYGNELGERDRALKLYESAIKRFRTPELLSRLTREYEAMSGVAQDEMAPVAAVAPAQETAPLGLQVVPEVRAKAGTLVELLAAGQDAETVWASGQWTGADVVWALEHVITDDGLLRGRPNEGKVAREALASLLARYGGELVSEENWRALPLKARLWLGDYYRRQNDDQAVAVLESVAEDGKQAKVRGGVLFNALEGLAWFYQERRQYEKSAETWLRVPTLYDNAAWMVADANWQAGRMYLWSGHAEKAELYFAKVDQENNNFFRGMVFYDKASVLLAERKPTLAKSLLITGLKTLKSNQDRVAAMSLLAQAYWDLEQWAEAEKSLQEVVRVGREPHGLPDIKGFEQLYKMDQQRLLSLQRWKNKTFDLPVDKVQITVGKEGARYVEFSVYSWDREPIQVNLDAANAVVVSLQGERTLRSRSGVLVSTYKLVYQDDDNSRDSLGSNAWVFIESDPSNKKLLELTYRRSESAPN